MNLPRYFHLLVAVLALCLCWAPTAQAAIPASERAVLDDLYASTNGAYWASKTNWNGAMGTECTWYGITCDGAQNNVVGINLQSNNLMGTLPSFSGLAALQFFDVSNNQLTGSIPSLSGLAALQYFVVSSNQLTGSIPPLDGLAALQYFAVNSNFLAGPVPAAPPSPFSGQIALCGNSLFSSGDQAIDAAWDTAAGNWLGCQLGAVTPPTCSLTATPAWIPAGNTSLLTASCSPDATSYEWSSGFSNAVSSGIVSPTATTTYTVTGSNAGGIGNTAYVTVTMVQAAFARVVEFYNASLDNYFITADANEATSIDGGNAGPGWSRTGHSFKSGGDTFVCRFYGSQSPGPNSHFYTVNAGECDSLKQQQVSTPATQKRWNFESLDFVSTAPDNGNCPTGTTPVYRAYNNGYARGVDSNHRITSSWTAMQEVVTRGWISEGVVMCAQN